ncbi:helix-turn-helix domain-containing protein, partial [Kibdelosporangium lantanae]
MGQHSGIGVLDKAMAVLQAVAKEPCGLAELCTKTGLPRATAHRLAVGLEVHRLLRRGSDGHWRPRSYDACVESYRPAHSAELMKSHADP